MLLVSQIHWLYFLFFQIPNPYRFFENEDEEINNRKIEEDTEKKKNLIEDKRWNTKIYKLQEIQKKKKIKKG